MFRPRHLPFSIVASDLYREASFQPLAPRVEVAAEATDAVHYAPAPMGSHGPFTEFMLTADFKTAQAQFLAHVALCKQFASTHCHAAEAASICSGLQTFEDRVSVRDGLNYYSTDQLQLLYSLGKQHFSSFCLMLPNPDIDLSTRLAALRELSADVTVCLASGPAFSKALLALQQPAGTMQGEYLRVLQEQLEESVRRFIHRKFAADDSIWLDGMEVHLVNRMKLELGLPGADLNDAPSVRAPLVKPTDVARCAVVLQNECRPADIARQLAAEYRQKLLYQASDRLGVPMFQVDADDNVHMDILRRVAQQLAPTYPGVSLASVLAEDCDAGHFALRTDTSLLARDVLRELVRRQYIQEPLALELGRGTTSDSRWQLRSLDGRVFFIEERLRSMPELPEIRSVGLRHLNLLYPAAQLRIPPTPLIQTVLEAETPDMLRDFPAAWVRSGHLADTLLMRLGPDRSAAWAIKHSLQDGQFRWLLPAATTQAHPAALRQWLRQCAHHAPEQLIQFAGGPDVFAAAVRSDNAAIAHTWLVWLGGALDTLTPPTVQAVLGGGARQEALLHVAALRGWAWMVDQLLVLSQRARANGQIDEPAHLGHIAVPLPQTSEDACRETVSVLVAHLGKTASQVSPDSKTLPDILWNIRVRHSGYLGAARRGHLHPLRAYQDLVWQLHERGHLSPSQAAHALLGELHQGWDVFNTALLNNQFEAMKVLAKTLLDAAKRGWISADSLTRIFTQCNVDIFGQQSLVMAPAEGHLATVWSDLLLTLHARKFLSSAQVFDILGYPAICVEGLPTTAQLRYRELTFLAALPYLPPQVLHRPTVPGNEQAWRWGRVVMLATEQGAITHGQLIQLLRSCHFSAAALWRAMADTPSSRAPVVEGMLRLYFACADRKLISTRELLRLLESRQPGTHEKTAMREASPARREVFAQAVFGRIRQGLMGQGLANRLLCRLHKSDFPDTTHYQAFIARMRRGIEEAIAAAHPSTTG